MPRVAIILETAGLQRVGLPIDTVAAYDIERDLDAAGTWAVEFPAGEALASQIRTRWRVSIIEEGRPGYLLRRGIVTDRQFQVGRTGEGVLRLAGLSRLFNLGRVSTHLGLAFAGTPILGIASALAGEAVTAPTVADVGSRAPLVTFNDTSNLAALLTALEYARLSIRETFDEDGFELVAWDDVPDSGYRFVTVAQAPHDPPPGLGLIAGTPRIGYNGHDLATRVIPVGVDFDGNPLTLAASTMTAPYPVRSALNPDGTPYYYLQDDNAVGRSELIELPMVRSDIKNPNDDPVSRTQAANALYAVGAGTLIQRKSDVIAFSSEIANGAQVDALPGSRVRVQFRGRAAGFGGGGAYWSLDQWFLVSKRRDAASAAGVRGVSFTLTAPEVPLRIPSLPNAIPIPPSPSDPPSPPDPSRDPTDPSHDDALAVDEPVDIPGADLGDIPLPPADVPLDLVPPGRDRGAYQGCCPDPTANNGGDNTPPPPDIDDGATIPTTGDVRAAWRNVIVTSSGGIDYQNAEDGSTAIRFFCATSAPVVITSDDSWAVIASNGVMAIYRGPALTPGQSGTLSWPPFGASVRMCGLRVDLAPPVVAIQAYERPFGFGPGFAAEISGDFEPISPDGDPVYATTPSILGSEIVP